MNLKRIMVAVCVSLLACVLSAARAEVAKQAGVANLKAVMPSSPARELDCGGYRIRSRAQPDSNVLARKALIVLLGYLLP